MKKILTFAALLSFFCACNKEVAPEDNTPSGEKQIITAIVNCPSKLSYSENTPGGGAGISSVWSDGDTFYAIQDGSTVVTFSLISGAGSTSAIFEAEAEGVTAATEWVAVLGKNASVHGTEIHCGYQSQNGAISSLNKYNYVKATGTGITPSFDFESGEKLSYIMRIKLPAGVKCIEYTPCAYWKITSSENSDVYYDATWYRINDSNDTHAFAAFQADHTSVITLSSASTSGQIIYIAVPTLNFSYTLDKGWSRYSTTPYGNLRSGVIVTIMNDDSDNADASNGSVLSADLRTKGGQVGTFDMSDMTLMRRPKPSESVTLTVSNYTGKYTNVNQKAEDHLATHWSPINLGADNPQDQGGLYSFGEVNPRTVFLPLNNSTHSHYNHQASFFDVIGAGDNLGGSITYTIAGSKYDAARVKWGVAWRMPHALELDALGRMSTRSDATVSGVGCLKLDLDSDSIYLPLQTGTFYTNLGYPDAGPWKAKTWAQGNAVTFLRSADQPQRGSSDGAAGNTDKAWYFSYLSKATETSYSASSSQGDYWLGNFTNRHLGFPIRPVLASSEWVR